MIDYQWPHRIRSSGESFIENGSQTDHAQLVHEIEEHFKNIFNAEVIAVPSGRSAIAILLRFFGLNRSHSVFAPLWTSHCVWDVITRVANPTTVFSKDCHTAVVVHKWGRVEKISKEMMSRFVIEDSVDSIIKSPDALFRSGGDVEIFSLPKLIGSYTGGLIAVKSKKIAREIRESISQNHALATHQSRLRFNSAIKGEPSFVSWEHCEYMNTTLDYNGLVNIQSCLSNYEKNSQCILKRLDVVRGVLGDIEVSPGRLPPVLPLECSKYTVQDSSEIMIRHYNVGGCIDKPDYQEVYLLPLHFGVSDEQFGKIFNQFKK